MRTEGQGGLTPAPRKIVIAGAGIAGLTAAIALAKRRFDVTLIDRAAQLEEAGAGLQLSPNASRILIELGLEPLLAPRVIAPDDIRIMRARGGAEILRMPLGPGAAARYGAPYWVLHRAELQSALLARLRDFPQIELWLDTAFEQVETTPACVNVACRGSAQSGSLQAAALIGADGVWSRLREQIFRTQAAFSGFIAWRGMAAAGALPAALRGESVMTWLNSGAHLVVYPMRDRGLLNVVAILPVALAEANDPDDTNTVSSYVENRRWAAEPRAIVAAVSSWTKWPLFKMPTAEFAQKRVALIGDASHAMPPFAAQGAAMAIEDAAILAASLARHADDAALAFRHYAELRRARVARVQRVTAQSGAIFHLPEPIATARDLTMKLVGGARLMAQRDWLYGWRPEISGHPDQ
jgi:salicylate hydroxylase